MWAPQILKKWAPLSFAPPPKFLAGCATENKYNDIKMPQKDS